MELKTTPLGSQKRFTDFDNLMGKREMVIVLICVHNQNFMSDCKILTQMW